MYLERYLFRQLGYLLVKFSFLFDLLNNNIICYFHLPINNLSSQKLLDNMRIIKEEMTSNNMNNKGSSIANWPSNPGITLVIIFLIGTTKSK